MFEYRDKVRDYECDIQGIVNNARYQHYLEVARHEYLSANGVSFSELHARGIDCVVARADLQYKSPLRPQEEFLVRVRVTKEGPKYVFWQQVVRASDGQLCVRARIDAVVLIDGVLSMGTDELDRLVEEN